MQKKAEAKAKQRKECMMYILAIKQKQDSYQECLKQNNLIINKY